MSRSPFNILYLSSFGELHGGGQKSLLSLITNVDRSLFTPYVVLPAEGNLGDELRKRRIEVVVIDFPRVLDWNIPQSIKSLYMLFMVCRAYDIDLIHTDGPRNTFYAGLIARLTHIPLIWHVRVSDKDRYDRILYHLASKLILVANALRLRFDWVNRDDAFVTIYNGVDPTDFIGETLNGSIRKHYGINEAGLLIVVMGRVETMKGQKYVIEACGLVRDVLGDFTLLLIGDVTDTNYRNTCQKRADQLGIGDRVVFAGYHKKVADFIVAADICVLPSLSEAFPRSVIEEMAAGKPVIVTDVGGCREAVENGKSGFVVPAGDPLTLSAPLRMLAMDRRLRETMGTEAKARVRDMFTIRQNVEKTEELYKTLLRPYS